jgi:predicted  nucleic acid-binding Zn-ribbon protein
LTGKSIGVQLYIKEIDTFYKEKLIGRLNKLKDTIRKDIPIKISEIQETHQRIRKDQDKLNKMKQDPQYNNMQQWGIQLSLERVREIDSKLINLTKLLNYITEKQKEQE